MIETRSYNVLNGNITHEKYKRVRKFKDFKELENERKRLQELHPDASIAFMLDETIKTDGAIISKRFKDVEEN